MINQSDIWLQQFSDYITLEFHTQNERYIWKRTIATLFVLGTSLCHGLSRKA